MFVKLYGVLAIVIDVLICCVFGIVKTYRHMVFALVLLPVIFLLLFAVHILLCLILSAFLNKKKPIERPNKFIKYILEQTINLVLFVLNYKVVEKGKDIIPTDRRFLLVSNHISAFDPISTIISIKEYDVAFVSKPENFKIPIAGELMHMCGFLAIDRDNARNSMKTLHKCVDYIKNDIASVCIYPEGHRSETGRLQEFKDGVFYVAKKSGCPVVVMTVRYEKRKPWGKKIFLDYKAVIEPDTFLDKTTHTISEQVRNIMLNK